MNDSEKIAAYCQAAQAAGEEISDACARVIASQWACGNMSATLSTTGMIDGDPSAVWREMFLPEYENGRMTRGDRLAADMLGTYLQARYRDGDTGPVAGWSGLWL